MKQLRLGIIGAGPIVEKKHLPALAEVPELAVVALCRRNHQELHQLADRFRIAQRSTDYRDLLGANDIDAVLIATGPEAQPQMVIEAAAAHKHIFVEKPMAETAAQAGQMAEAIKAAKVHFHIGFNKRFYYGYRQAKTLIQAGEIGELSGLQARFWFQPGRRDPMLHNGIHFFDLISFFMGPVSEVFARRYTLPPPDPHVAAPETLSVSMQFETGAVGNLLLSSLASWNYVNEHIDLIGSNHNVLSIENGRQVRVFRRGEDQPAQLYENTLSVHWWSGHEEQGFVPQLRAFAQSIVDGSDQLSRPDDMRSMSAHMEDGIRSLVLLEAVQSSITQGVNLSIPPFMSTAT
jgi:myo-inositol 2-dehydrogenase/D-chiro-inositol 1-dehydrogenase